MPSLVLLNTVTIANEKHYAGSFYDSANEAVQVAKLTEAGGQFVPLPNPAIEKAAAIATKRRARMGAHGTEVDSLILAAVAVEGLSGGGVPPTRIVASGAGLTGGGDLTADRTLAVSPNADGSISLAGGKVGVGALASDAQHGARGGGTQHADATALLAGFMAAADKSKLDAFPASAVPTSRTVSTTAPLAGGGDLSADRTLSIADPSDTSKGAVPFVGAVGTLLTSTGTGVTWSANAATPTSRTIGTTAPLAGGGDMSADRTLSIADPSATSKGAVPAITASNVLLVSTAGTAAAWATLDDTLHGSRGGGSTHAVATSLVAGFMSAADKSALDAIDTSVFTLTSGARAFSGTVGGVTPTSAAHLATKGYVDSLVRGLDPQESVITKSLSAPPTPTLGARYIVKATGSAAWLGKDNQIATGTGTGWDFTVPNQGFWLTVEDESKQYVFNGSAWVSLSSTIDHSATLNLGNDDHTQYVHNTTARTITAQHSFSPGVAQAPFALGANAQGQLVTGLNADTVDGSHASAFVGTGRTISTTAPLSGGGDLSANRAIAITLGTADHVLVMNAGGTAWTSAALANANVAVAAAIDVTKLASAAAGSLFVTAGSPTPANGFLAPGTNGYVLTMVAGAPAWATNAAAPTSRTISTTSPLAGGGDLSADRTLSVATVSSTSAGVAPIVPGASAGFVLTTNGTTVSWAVNAATPTSRSISTTAPLAGGGDLSADRTLSVATATTTTTGVVPAQGTPGAQRALVTDGAGVMSWAQLSTAAIGDATITPAKVLAGAATGGLVYTSSATVFSWLGIGSTGNVLTVVGGVPAWAAHNDVPTSRTITATAPVTIDGTTSADLSANRTLAVSLATTTVNGVVPGTGTTADRFLRTDAAGVMTWVRVPIAGIAPGTVGQMLYTDAAPSAQWLAHPGAAGRLMVTTATIPSWSGAPSNGAIWRGTSTTASGYYSHPGAKGRLLLTDSTTSLAWMSSSGLAGGILYNSSADTPAWLAVGTNTQILTSNGTVPGWSSLSAIDHNSLNNLATGDVHTHYALLAGRSGGQTLIGGTASGNNLTLQSTSNATRGRIVSEEQTVTASGAAIIASIVKGASAQSANLTEWQNSAGTILATVDSAGHRTQRNQTELRFYELTANGTNFAAFRAAASMAADVTWTLPAADGTSAQVLSTNGSGTLSWATPSATDSNAIHTNVSGEIAGLTQKSTPVGADHLLIEDSAASNAKKRMTVTNLLDIGATKLKSATTVVDVSAATAPSNGQVLTATSSTTATWQTPSSGSQAAEVFETHHLSACDQASLDPQGQGWIMGALWRCPRNMTVTSMQCFVSQKNTGNVYMAIYSSADKPVLVVGEATGVSCSTVGLKSVAISSTSLTKGTLYYLCIRSDANGSRFLGQSCLNQVFDTWGQPLSINSTNGQTSFPTNFPWGNTNGTSPYVSVSE